MKQTNDSHHFVKVLQEMEGVVTYLENVLYSAPDAIVVINYDGKMKTVNHAVIALLGYEKETLIGRDAGILLAEKGAVFFEQEALGRLMQEGSVTNLEVVFRSQEEKEIPILLSGSVLRDDQGKLLGVVLVGKDITKIRELDRMKDQFLSTVSHELRTPLTIIILSIANLNDGIAGPLSEKQEELVAMANRNCVRLGRLIEDLLDLSRLESGQSKFHPARFSLPPLIHEIVKSFRVSEHGEKVFVEEVPDHLPDLSADREMLARVLTNLIQNAVRFAKTKIVVKAGKSPSPGREWVQVSVINDGCGIPEEEQGNLFNKFVQLHRPEGGAGYKGTGLGLAICKESIEKHGGKIWVESHTDGGAAFHFTVPAWRLMMKNDKKKGLLLIVDDEPDFVSTLKLHLEVSGYFSVSVAYDGQEGMAKVRQERPDLILLDAAMPVMDGFQLCQRLKEDPSTKPIPIILLTAKSRQEDRVRGMEVGADAYLTKPFEFDALLGKIGELLSSGENAPREEGVIKEPG